MKFINYALVFFAGVMVFSKANAVPYGTAFLSIFGIGGEIEVQVEKDYSACNASAPLLVKIENNTGDPITQIEFIAYVQEENRSRAECAEGFDLRDILVRSGESYVGCFSTLQEKGIIYNGRRLSDKEMDDAIDMSSIEYADTYGGDMYNDSRGGVGRYGINHLKATTTVSPKQSLGCRGIDNQSEWRGKVTNYRVFEE